MNDTAPHSDKDTLPKAYEFAEVEQRWYARWLDDKTFSARMDEGKPAFSIVIPPPNVTGVLHIGHALNNTLQDLLVRYHRMRGDNTLWVPGTDHAGIATQNVVERQLATENLSRHDLGRDRFIERVWAWREEKGGTIINQLKLGASCDSDRERFTMDEGLSRAVREVRPAVQGRPHLQGRLHRQLVSALPHRARRRRGRARPHGRQALPHPLPMPTARATWWWPPPGRRPCSATPPVAVHPDAEAGTREIGISLPLTRPHHPGGVRPPLQREFGTGALKVTPAHDRDDYEIGLRHDLPRLKVMDDKGVMNEAAGSYAGLDRFACRQKIVSDLQEQGFLERIEDYQHAVGKCYRLQRWSSHLQAVVRQRSPAGRQGGGRGSGRPHRACELLVAPSTAGWRTSATGASAGRSGGATASRPGPARAAASWWSTSRNPTCARSAARPACARKTTCSTPGSARPCGPSPPWAGRRRPRNWPPSTRPRCSSPVSTSSSSGWRE